MDGSDFVDRLLPGERIAWSGEAGRGLMLTSQDAFLIPFSLLWCGFAIFWESQVTATGAPTLFKLWGAMFIGIGLYFVAGRFVVDAWVRRGVRYALTNQRILISRTRPFPKFTALSLTRLPEVSLREQRNGRGTIWFGVEVPMWRNRSIAAWTPALDKTPRFISVENAARVYDLIQRRSR